jgi:hypothetical protein
MSSAVLISIRGLLHTGAFAELPFGISRDQFLDRLGETKDVIFDSRRNRIPTLLRYGNVEFFVTADSNIFYGFLWKPYNDHNEVPTGTDRLRIDPWILRRGVSRKTIEHELKKENISFGSSVRSDGVRSLSLASRVDLNFWTEDDEEGDVLTSISAMRRELLPYQEPEKQISVTLTKSEVERLKRGAGRRRISMAKLCAEWIRRSLAEETQVEETLSPEH